MLTSNGVGTYPSVSALASTWRLDSKEGSLQSMLQTTLRVGMSRAGNLQMRDLESHTPMGLIGWDTPNGPKESMDLGSPMDSFYKG